MLLNFVLESSPLDEFDDVTGLLADALVHRGHEVRIVAAERPPGFRGGRRAEWIDHAPAGGITVPRTTIEATVIVAEDAFRDRPRRESSPLRVLLPGAIESVARGVEDGYGAIAHARWFHQKLELVRTSPWAPSRGEPLDDVQEFHVGLTDDEAVRLLHTCDVVLVPARVDAGISLVAAEAMAASVAVVLTSTPAHSRLAGEAAAHFGPERNPVELGEALIEILGDEELRGRLRLNGRQLAETFRGDSVAAAVEQSLR